MPKVTVSPKKDLFSICWFEIELWIIIILTFWFNFFFRLSKNWIDIRCMLSALIWCYTQYSENSAILIFYRLKIYFWNRFSKKYHPVTWNSRFNRNFCNITAPGVRCIQIPNRQPNKSRELFERIWSVETGIKIIFAWSE